MADDNVKIFWRSKVMATAVGFLVAGTSAIPTPTEAAPSKSPLNLSEAPASKIDEAKEFLKNLKDSATNTQDAPKVAQWWGNFGNFPNWGNWYSFSNWGG